MDEKYRLQFWNPRNTTLSINFARDIENYVPGDFRVRAIKAHTDIESHNKAHFQKQHYTEPMTLNQARKFISNHKIMVGQVHDCVGLTLEDSIDEFVDFTNPIKIRNIKKK